MNWQYLQRLGMNSYFSNEFISESLFFAHSMIEVSAEAWHVILFLVTPWQYLQRLGMLFYILSHLGRHHLLPAATWQ